MTLRSSLYRTSLLRRRAAHAREVNALVVSADAAEVQERQAVVVWQVAQAAELPGVVVAAVQLDAMAAQALEQVALRLRSYSVRTAHRPRRLPQVPQPIVVAAEPLATRGFRRSRLARSGTRAFSADRRNAHRQAARLVQTLRHPSSTDR